MARKRDTSKTIRIEKPLVTQKRAVNMYCMTLGLIKEIEKQNNPSPQTKDLEDLEEAREIVSWDPSRTYYMDKPTQKDVEEASETMKKLAEKHNYDSGLRKYDEDWNLLHPKGYQCP